MSALLDMPPRSTLPTPKSRPPPASASSHAHSSAHTSYTNAPKPSSLSTSRPGTPSSHSRKSAPQSRNESPARHQRESMEKAPFTPSPRPQRKRRGNQPSNQRSEFEPQPASPEEEDAALFDLLGVAPPPKKAEPEPQLESRRGVIVLPEGEGLNGTKKQKNRRKNKKTPEEDFRNDGLPRDQAESSRRKKKPVKPMLTEAFSAPAQQLSQPSSIDSLMASATKNSPPFSTSSPKPRSRDVKRAENDGAYETASLSKSLPADVDGVSLMASGVKTKKGKKEDESAVWDMPEGSGSQTLTWQQKLAQTETPPRNSRKGFATERKPKSKLSTLYNPSTTSNSSSRPSHGRRLSYDSLAQPYHLSQPSITALPPASQRENPSLSGVPISAFDGHIPFHTGYNVHRAPQTPAKTVATAHGNLLNGDGSLPLIPGEFPRLQSEGSGSGSIGSAGGKGMGMKYAGPTFHNSPHAATLSKPDMEDF